MKKRKNLKDIFLKLSLITLFGIAFGHLEGVVVYYLRLVLTSNLPLQNWTNSLLFVEQTREAATIVMLVVFAWLIGKTNWEKLAIFLWTFAIWDLFYYLSLYIMLGWPSSLSTTDVLFLIPVPWVAPVWAPIAIMILFLIISGYILTKK